VLITLSVLPLSRNISISQIRGSDLVVSVNRSTSQNYIPRASIHITTDGQLATVVTSGTGTASNPYIITGWNITSHWGAIHITGTTKHFRIEKCWINNSDGHAIFLDSVPAGTASIINNFCTNYGWNNIYLRSSGSSIIANNTCNNGDITLEDSSSSTITNNTCNDGSICLSDSGYSTITNNICNVIRNDGIILEDSEFSKITNNTCNNCSIYLSESESSTLTNNSCNGNSGYGIRLWKSSHSTMTNNSCYDNGNGIELAYSDYNLIICNKLSENSGYGLELSEFSDNNSIHHNSFIQNGQNTSQACDDGLNNQWYDDTVLEGNYWSDYNGTGSYFIAGSAGASDPYPSGEPHHPTPSGIDLNDFFSLLVRVGLFLGILGVLAATIFLSRRR
jgi:parallel beta-helix repeat protein